MKSSEEEEEEDDDSASWVVSVGAVAVLGFLVNEADGLLEVSRGVLDFGRTGMPRTPPMEGKLAVFKELEPRCGGGGLPSSEDTYLRFVLLLRGDMTRVSGAPSLVFLG